MADWSINLPLSELAALQELPARMVALEDEIKRLRTENIGLRRQYSELLTFVADLQRQMRKS